MARGGVSDRGSPSYPGPELQLCRLCGFSEMGKSTEALAATEKAAVILQKLAKANPGNTGLQYDLALNLRSLGHLLWGAGKWAETLAALENARAILERLVEDNPAVTRYRYALGQTYNNIGSTLFDEGKPVEALAFHEKVCAIAVKLTDTYPPVNLFQGLLATNQCNIGRALSETGKFTEGMAAHAKALDISQQLAQGNPSDIGVKWLLAFSYNGIGELLAQTGRPVEALKFYENARVLLVKPMDAPPAGYTGAGRTGEQSREHRLVVSRVGKAEGCPGGMPGGVGHPPEAEQCSTCSRMVAVGTSGQLLCAGYCAVPRWPIHRGSRLVPPSDRVS